MEVVARPAFWLQSFSVISLAVTLILASAVHAQDAGQIAYVGTYTGKGSEGIYAFRFNSANGEVQPLGAVASTENPSFLAIHPGGGYLYAVNELDGFKNKPAGAVSVFSIEKGSGALTFLQQVSSLGRGPAHVSLDRSGRFLLVANYGGGNVAVFPIRHDGRLGRHSVLMQATGSSVNRERQEAPHAHCIQATPDNRFVLVADLGIDRLLVYRFDPHNGTLTRDGGRTRSVEPGAGPRHFAFAPSGKQLFLANELASSVTSFAYDATEGLLTMKQTQSTLSSGFAGENSVAEIVVHPGGKYLYVSNRGDDSIIVFNIDPESGSLTFVQRVSSGGKTPRNIALDPTGRWLFSANQNSDRIALFRVGSEDGRLMSVSQSLSVPSPVCITFLPGR